MFCIKPSVIEKVRMVHTSSVRHLPIVSSKDAVMDQKDKDTAKACRRDATPWVWGHESGNFMEVSKLNPNVQEEYLR